MSFIWFPVLQALQKTFIYFLSDSFADIFPFLWQKGLPSMPERGLPKSHMRILTLYEYIYIDQYMYTVC